MQQDSEFHQIYQREDEWCREHGISPRTSANYRKNAGLPYLLMKYVWIPRKEAAEFLAARVRRGRNPPRRKRQAAPAAEISP